MDENGSCDESSDSITTSEDFEIILAEPQFSFAGKQDELESNMKEALMDSAESTNPDSNAEGKSKQPKLVHSVSTESRKKTMVGTTTSDHPLSMPDRPEPQMETIQSVIEINKSEQPQLFSSSSATNDVVTGVCNRNRANSTDAMVYRGDCVSVIDQADLTESICEADCTIFNQITYLGSATINAPRSESEIQRNLEILNAETKAAIEVSVTVPSTSEGCVRLLEASSPNSEIALFRIHRILFVARGRVGTSESTCFAFTCSHGDSAETTIFQCHVFKCDIPEAVGRILLCFAAAFRRIPKPMHPMVFPDGPLPPPHHSLQERTHEHLYVFEVNLEIREDDGKGNLNSCPRDKDCFKLRSSLTKKVMLTVQQLSSNSNRELNVDRCFGILVSQGRNLKHSDMQLLEGVTMNVNQGDRKLYSVAGHWDPNDSAFEVLNRETQKDRRVYMTVAVDLVVQGIQEPVRFVLETKAKIFSPSERFWYFTRKSLTEHFYLKLKEIESKGSPEMHYHVVSIESSSAVERKKNSLTLGLRSPGSSEGSTMATPSGDAEDESDNDEPLLSGSGDVSKDCSEDELVNWADVLSKWRQNINQRPKQLTGLVRRGIPEALRAEVWQLLAGCDNDKEMMENYRVLITKESPCEQVILRDINRTFPAHDYFKETGGLGQDALYKLSKAYSVYDEEVGYCQGLSFLAAALLLHMPEEQAFCILVKIMFQYKLRELFKDGFQALHLKFYQLQKLIEEHIPELNQHFFDLGVEVHMYGSQWFLTLFTAKFPLFLVFHILDIFLCEGVDTIFQVALALLQMSKKELLALDFEGVLKYFRVSLPKKFRTEENAKNLIRLACSTKVKKLKKYEKDYLIMKEQERQQEDPIERLERENKRLMAANLRLEQENDDLAHELVTSKIQLRNDLDVAEDKADSLNKELMSTSTMLVDTEEEKRRLEIEANQLKEMCRRELVRAETDNTRNSAIINDYKQICSQLSDRLEKEKQLSSEILNRLKNNIKDCDRCWQLVGQDEAMASSVETAELTEEEMENEDYSKKRLGDAIKQIRELELELAQTKLALVEAECRNQDLIHSLNSIQTEMQAPKNTWLQKTLTSIREVTKKDVTGSNKEG